MSASIYDVARRAGVSIATVSRVLNSPVSVRADKVSAVRNAMKELQYEPSLFGRGLANQSFKTVGVYFPYGADSVFSSSYCIELLKGIEAVLTDHGFDLLILPETAGTLHKNGIPRFVEYIKQRKIDGLLLSSVDTSTIVSVFGNYGIDVQFPIVYIGKKQEKDFANVYAQFEDYMFDSISRLHEKGHRHILLLTLKGHRQYWKTIISRIKRQFPQLAIQKEELPDIFAIDQQTFVASCLEKTVIHDSCTAVCCECIDQARMVLNSCAELKLAVPSDVSVIAVEHRKGEGALLYPPLDAVSVPSEAMGRSAAGLLVRIIAGTAGNEQILVAPDYMNRSSVL